MRRPLAIRIDGEVLAAAKLCARQDNRTLTNLIETLLRERIAASPSVKADCISAQAPTQGSTRAD
ncbi:DUF6364 family protein [Methylobacterium sp. J-048]|uniref:DUF6364 family protein n=1 Tax=Methylobacterium sp. J-048 TaxID=2836635 RepID=UPI001FB941DB|nr:DUF6364 family protein [Methylobacterium sp. J-048]MCJ2061063.1 DUF6364 family protein [Methylobacterium sp. J-048]